MKFKDYILKNKSILTEKITKNKFNEILKNKNIFGGCEFEFYLRGIDKNKFNEIKKLLIKVNTEVENVNKNITEYNIAVMKLQDDRDKYDREINDLENKIQNETNQNKIDKYNNKIKNLKDNIENIDDGNEEDYLRERYDPIPNIYSLSYYFELMEELSNYGLYTYDLENERIFNEKCYEWFENEEVLTPESELNFDIDDDIFNEYDVDENTLIDKNFPFDLNGWEVKEDGSLDSGGVEIVTPILELSDLINKIDKVFKWIEDNGETDNTTGFHVHLSMKSDNKIDPLKLILFAEEDFIYKYFGSRKYNKFALGIRQGHFDELDEPFTKENIIELAKKDKIEKKMNTNKYLGIHLIDLEKNHVEFRYMGGTNYEKKFDEVRKIIINYAYWLGIALDPKYKKKEYILKVNRLTNYFNALYYFNLISNFERLVSKNKKAQSKISLKDYNKIAEDFIKPYKKKLKNLTKLKSYNIKNSSFLSNIMDAAIDLYSDFLVKIIEVSK